MTAKASVRDAGGKLAGTTRWRGAVRLAADVFVPEGAVLEVEAGALVEAAPAPAWRYVFDRPGERGAAYSSSAALCTLVVRGTLRVLGRPGRPARFEAGLWNGVALLGRGRAEIEHAQFAGAQLAGLACFDRSSAGLLTVRVRECRAGVFAGGFSRVSVRDALFEGNGRGLLACDFARLRAEGCRCHGNGDGADVGDGARVELLACGFRANARVGLVAQGAARVAASRSAFEGHPREAAVLRESARLRAAQNRFFHNVEGYSLRDGARLDSEGDIIGPSARVGVQVAGGARADFRDGFFHSHDAEPAVRAREGARVRFAGSRFYSNGAGFRAEGRARWELDGCVFKGNDRAAVEAVGLSAGAAGRVEFAENGVGLLLRGGARARVSDSRFVKNTGRGAHVLDAGRLDARRAGFEGNSVGLEGQDDAALDLADCELRAQSVHGVLLQQRARARAVRSRFVENGAAGLQALGEAAVRLLRNEFTGNAVGAGLQERASGLVRKNAFHAQRREGASCASGGRVVILDNVFSRNRVGVGHFGADRSLVRRNRFVGQREAAGLCAGDAAPRWEGNRCLDNASALECRDRARPVVEDNRFAEASA